MAARIALSLSLILVLLTPAAAGETRTLELPRAGLSLDVPSDWKIVQDGDAPLELRDGNCVVRIRPYESGAPQPPTRRWSKLETPGDISHHCNAWIGRDGVSVLEVVAKMPEEYDRQVVDALLDSIDTTPYLYPTRYVDWNAGWTLTLPDGWERKVEVDGDVLQFEAQDRTARLWVEDLQRVMKAAGGSEETPRDLDTWADFAWKEGLLRLQQVEGVTSEEAPVVETIARGDLEGRRMHLGVDLDGAGKPRAWMHVLVLDGYRVLAYVRGSTDEAATALREAVDSFRRGTHPGPRVSATEPTDRFPGDKGPAVVFSLPAGWKTTPGTNAMRLAQVEMGDVEGVEAVVFFFGPGSGGAVDDNMARWRKQMGNEDGGTVEVHEPVEGVKITLLDVTGTYQTSSMNPHGADPHGNPHGGGGSSDSRMLGAVIEVPGGPLFVKVVGPEDAMADLVGDVTTWLLSFRPVL